MSLGFNTALSALSAARVALQTIGHNIANANTPGYTRQRVLFSPSAPSPIGSNLLVGNGVTLASIDAVSDSLLTARVRSQSQELGFATAQSEIFTDVESALGEPGNGGVGSLMDDFFSSLEGLRSSPSDPAVRSSVIQKAQSLVQGFRGSRGNLSRIHTDVRDAIRQETSKVNQLLNNLAEVNRTIVTSGFGAEVPSDVQDRQNQLLLELSRSVDVAVNRQATGQIVVTSGGQVLLDPSSAHPIAVQSSGATTAPVALRAGRSTTPFEPRAGRLAGLMQLEPSIGQDHVDILDQLAHKLIEAVNHVHATGTPPSGGYSTVVATNAFQDVNESGSVLDESIASAGLPFEVNDGNLTVNVRNTSTNTTEQIRIPIDTATTTVGDLQAAISGIPNLTASIDGRGRLRISADTGYEFDFSARLNPTPNTGGSLGSDRATLVANSTFPLSITSGSQFSIRTDGGPAQTITFNASAFADPSRATASEVATAINAQISGAQASVVAGKLVLRSTTSGTSGTLQVTDGTGSPAATLQLPTTLETGQHNAVDVRVTGTFSGGLDRSFTLRPSSTGVIGQTAGLTMQVFDSDGTLVGNLAVGSGYSPGTPLEIADGVRVSLGAGMVHSTNNEFLQIDAIADSDTSGVLTATGTNSFFSGSDANDIAINADISANSNLFATGIGGGAGDSTNIARLVGTRTRRLSDLGERSVQERLDALISETGFNAQRASTTVDTQQLLLDQAQNRLQSVSGVNIDEELLNLEAYQKSFEVAARFAQTMAEVSDTLVNLVR